MPVVMMMLLLLGLEFLAQEAEAVFSASRSSIQTRLLFILDIMLFLTEAKLVWVLAREYWVGWWGEKGRDRVKDVAEGKGHCFFFFFWRERYTTYNNQPPLPPYKYNAASPKVEEQTPSKRKKLDKKKAKGKLAIWFVL